MSGVIRHEVSSTFPSGRVEKPVLSEVLRSALPVNTSRWVVEPGGTSVPEKHDDHEIWQIARGTGVITYGGVDQRVVPGDVVYLEPQTLHEVRNDSDSDLWVFSLWWV